jgi:hypothetical protein
VMNAPRIIATENWLSAPSSAAATERAVNRS